MERCEDTLSVSENASGKALERADSQAALVWREDDKGVTRQFANDRQT